MSAPLDTRPFPIREAFSSLPNALRFAASIVALLVGYGVFTVAQGSAVEGLLGAVPGLVALVADVVREFRVREAIKAAERQVTPLSSPAIVVDGELVHADLVPARG